MRLSANNMINLMHSDPAERDVFMRLLYRKWRPTLLGRWIGRLMIWWKVLGLPLENVVVLEVHDRKSGRTTAVPLVIIPVNGNRYVVSMLGSEANWVKAVEATHGDAVLRHGRREPVHLVVVPSDERPPILREYVRIAASGRKHFPVDFGAPLTEFQKIAEFYPVYRVDQPPCGANAS